MEMEAFLVILALVVDNRTPKKKTRVQIPLYFLFLLKRSPKMQSVKDRQKFLMQKNLLTDDLDLCRNEISVVYLNLF